jgi:hypothetical protein
VLGRRRQGLPSGLPRISGELVSNPDPPRIGCRCRHGNCVEAYQAELEREGKHRLAADLWRERYLVPCRRCVNFCDHTGGAFATEQAPADFRCANCDQPVEGPAELEASSS